MIQSCLQKWLPFMMKAWENKNQNKYFRKTLKKDLKIFEIREKTAVYIFKIRDIMILQARKRGVKYAV